MATHHFQPDHYYTTIGSHAPVLRIAAGDTVRTTTVDASGRDASGTPIAPRGNPQTGPFYIEGAAPGDTLVLQINRIQPNRNYGWTSHSLAPNVVDPHYVSELYQIAKGQPWEPVIWDIDTEAATATLARPETRLGRLALPLAPMLGCFGVAPEGGQAISTATSGQHGGNMDYRGFVSGVTVYFPVFVEGALLFLGDGHALQGDGEIGGTGVEISMDVEFSVDVIKGKPIGWPRGENNDYIFTVGNARPLDQCVQHATTEMARWLQTDYGLDAQSAGLLMSQTVEYDLGNMFDPAYTMVCKMPKAILQRLSHIQNSSS
jgi:acetamidase/formamidase